ncbi:glycerol-3-phosphate responsive antiterminator [Siminovitchia sediminis]|uniref:Glycerol uptake operon antiterminator regulatory protein n=1 Tax=Siminovitchia sediminis TaxID=1274353 RepID=A0ABW4KPG3_9BACI
MKRTFEEKLEKHKLIAAIKEPKCIERAIKYKENIAAVILMTGNILQVKQYVGVLQDAGLPVILHVEKIGGLQLDPHGIGFIRDYVKPFAIVTTKPAIIKRAKAGGLYVIQRIFLIDTEVYEHLLAGLEQRQADMIEIMPSRACDFLKKLSEVSPVPVITGGLLSTLDHAREALAHGAAAVSTSNTELWKVDMNDL